MPYLFLIAGLLFGLIALYRFLTVADRRQVVVLLLSLVALTVVVALFYMAVTGKLAASIGLLAALWPVIAGLLHTYKAGRFETHEKLHEEFRRKTPGDDPLTRTEALEILDLPENASREEIVAAHRRLIGKVHPDREGSKWLAAKINAARDSLLK
ncbi:MAG: molecular chaperone DnaJ [Alphaproteobacteria bacterium]|nr:molecular chaperone DnaJ [Alphaproteobacteria bacterium]